jgi:hypothetical protein
VTIDCHSDTGSVANISADADGRSLIAKSGTSNELADGNGGGAKTIGEPEALAPGAFVAPTTAALAAGASTNTMLWHLGQATIWPTTDGSVTFNRALQVVQ